MITEKKVEIKIQVVLPERLLNFLIVIAGRVLNGLIVIGLTSVFGNPIAIGSILKSQGMGDDLPISSEVKR